MRRFESMQQAQRFLRVQLLFAIYSILAVTLFQPKTIGFSGCVLLRLGITLQRYERYLLKFYQAE